MMNLVILEALDKVAELARYHDVSEGEVIRVAVKLNEIEDGDIYDSDIDEVAETLGIPNDCVVEVMDSLL